MACPAARPSRHRWPPAWQTHACPLSGGKPARGGHVCGRESGASGRTGLGAAVGRAAGGPVPSLAHSARGRPSSASICMHASAVMTAPARTSLIAVASDSLLRTPQLSPRRQHAVTAHTAACSGASTRSGAGNNAECIAGNTASAKGRRPRPTTGPTLAPAPAAAARAAPALQLAESPNAAALLLATSQPSPPAVAAGAAAACAAVSGRKSWRQESELE